MTIEYKKPFSTEAAPIKEIARGNVKVKFNFSLASSQYDPSICLKKAREEKSYVAFEQQNHIDINTVSNFYEAGKIYDVPEEFYTKFCGRSVETYNSFFGKFEGKAQKLAKRPIVPYLLRVDEKGNLLDPMQQKLDLYPTNDD